MTRTTHHHIFNLKWRLVQVEAALQQLRLEIEELMKLLAEEEQRGQH